jgi:hypothetical protein
MMINNAVFLGFPEPFRSLLILLLIAVLIFEIYMFFHVIRNKFIATNRKLLWLIGMLLLHPFIAIAYYFTDYKKEE